MRTPLTGQRRFRTASLKILAGGVGGTAILLVLTPILTRLFSPEVFGQFTMIIAVASVFVGFSTLRLEVFAQAESEKSRANSALALGGLVTFTVGATLLIVSTVAIVAFSKPLVWLLLGPTAVLASFQLLGTAVLAKNGSYGRLGAANFVQQGGSAVIQVLAGLVSASAGALVAGFALARTVWLIPISTLRVPGREQIRAYWIDKRRQAVIAGGSALINSAAGQALPILMAATYGVWATGIVAMATRIVASPMSMIGQAVAGAVVGEVGREIRQGNVDRAQKIVTRGMRDNALLAAFPLLAAAIAGPILVPTLLGDSWKAAGTAVSALSLGVFAQFSVSPFSQVMNLMADNKRLLTWDVVRLVVLAASLIVPSLLDLDWTVAVWTYAVGQAVVYIILAFWIVSALSNKRTADL